MFRAHRAHQKERQIVSIQPLVTVTLCWWPCHVQTRTRHAHQLRVTFTRGCIDIIYLSWCWARCARNMWRVQNKNKYIERNLCVTLVIYQESLHDARSTKYKIQNFSPQVLRRTVVDTSWLNNACFLDYVKNSAQRDRPIKQRLSFHLPGGSNLLLAITKFDCVQLPDADVGK